MPLPRRLNALVLAVRGFLLDGLGVLDGLGAFGPSYLRCFAGSKIRGGLGLEVLSYFERNPVGLGATAAPTL